MPRLVVSALTAQALLLTSVIVTALALPPARGAMTLVPLGRSSTAVALNLALVNHAQIVNRGPIPGSIIIRGERHRLFGPLLRNGVLLIAAPARWCGA